MPVDALSLLHVIARFHEGTWFALEIPIARLLHEIWGDCTFQMSMQWPHPGEVWAVRVAGQRVRDGSSATRPTRQGSKQVAEIARLLSLR